MGVLISDLNGANSKTDFRSYLKERLRLFALNSSVKSTADSRIVNHITSFLAQNSDVVGAYQNLSDEPNLSGFYASTTQELAFPIVSSQEMRFLSVDRVGSTDWLVDSLGFRYPASGDVVDVESLSVILVPGLGFSSFGERLGRGKGFYDQYLGKFKGIKIGVCFDCQWSDDHLPSDVWDIKMNYIITESKCVEIKD